MSSSSPAYRRKPAAERRAEIVRAAADLALRGGLERVTLKSVAERLGVRTGLISHYFSAVGDLVDEAFALAVSEEREKLFPPGASPTDRVIALIERVQSPEARDLARLWLNARHLSRFQPSLEARLAGQEEEDFDRLVTLIREGIRSGEFLIDDADFAAARIFTAIDGFAAYVNSRTPFVNAGYEGFISDVAEWSLGLASGALRRC